MQRLSRRYYQQVRRQGRSHRELTARDVTYQLLLASLNVAWHWSEIIFDAHGVPCDMRMVDCNVPCEVVFGKRREELVGWAHHDIWPSAEPFWFDIALEVAQTGKPVHFERASVVTHAYWDCYVFSPAYMTIAMFYQDISERMRSQQAIQQLNRDLAARATELEAVVEELEAFTRTVSHDLRAPIRYIGGFTDLLERELDVNVSDKGRHFLDIIRKSTGNMGLLMDQLLELSRSTRAPMMKEAVRLDDLVTKAWEGLALDREGRNIQWEMAPLPTVRGDPVLLQNVLTNLLSNAIKYTQTKAEARVQVGCLEAEGEITLFIRDNGIGFDQGLAHRLFKVFERLNTDPRILGSGIGLATVQRIIQRHGGRVWAEGQLGLGSTFYLTLPTDQPGSA
ncbi:MAG: ATP-binding protein [Holophaga sp.]|nr:ATP-binding protein [Holophaga sp.]